MKCGPISLELQSDIASEPILPTVTADEIRSYLYVANDFQPSQFDAGRSDCRRGKDAANLAGPGDPPLATLVCLTPA